MKIAAASADRFITKPDAKIRAIVLYGPDEGLVGERARRAALTVVPDLADAFRLVELSGGQLKDDPARLADEMGAISLMGGRRVIRVRPAGEDSAAALENALNAPGDALIVLEAGDLKKSSKLRKLAEDHQAIAAIACYADDERALEQLVQSALTENKLKPDPGVAQWLVDNLGGDRGVSRRELEKLALYFGADGEKGGEVSLDDCLAIVGDSAALGLDDVALAVGDGYQAALDRALDRVLAEGHAAVSILRALSRHFLRLHGLSAMVQGGVAPAAAVDRARPPVHFKVKPRLVRQLALWSPAHLGRALDLLTEAELQCKTTGMPDRTICRRACLALANAANQAARAAGRVPAGARR